MRGECRHERKRVRNRERNRGSGPIALLLCALASVANAAELTELLQPGEPLEEAFAELGRQGYQITYSSNVVRSTMRLQSAPRAADIDALLHEILMPWGLVAIKAGDRDYLIVAAVTKRSVARSNESAAPQLPSIETVNVTATRFDIGTAGTESTTLSAHDVQRLPHLADDAMRVLKSLPGTAGRDLSARVSVRGGRPDELMMLIDGAEIHNGFHFQEGEDGVLSLVDTNLVQSMEFTTGGMTAEYGDYMSGVVDIATREPAANAADNNAIGISFISSFARMGRTFDDGRGLWIASARRSYLDLLISEVQDDNERLTPQYQDAFAAVRYQLSDTTSLAAHALLGSDKLVDIKHRENSREAGEGETSHLWFTLDQDWSDSLKSSTVLAWATGDRHRDNFDEHGGGMIGDLVLKSQLGYWDLRQDWTWLAADEGLLKWGLSASRHEASYHYRLQSLAIDSLDPTRVVTHDDALTLEAAGNKVGVYAAYKSRFGDRLTLESGARWDRYGYKHGDSYARVSPRFNALYQLNGRSELRAAWGITHQPQAIDNLDVTDGETQYGAPETARHIILGYATRLFETMNLRVDVYRKDYSNLLPRYENELWRVRLIPEAEADRMRIDARRARARGVEVTLRRDTHEQWGGWLTYGYSEAEDRQDDRWRTRTWQQKHTAILGVGRSGNAWDANLVAYYHSGSPTTPLYFVPVQGPDGSVHTVLAAGTSNSATLANYLRVDLRASRRMTFEKSALTFYVEVFNVFDRKNPCCLDDLDEVQDARNTQPALNYSYGFPRLPSFGFNYEF